MLSSFKRLIRGREPTPQERFEQVVARLREGWTLEAFLALQQLAEGGLAAAQHELGRRYERALGVVRSLDDAQHWYEQAAEQGLHEAQARLGLMLLTGPQDAPRGAAGVALPRRSGASLAGGSGGAARAIYRQDLPRAAHWHRRAAEAGHAAAQLRLGLQLAKGLGIERDLDEARQWLTRSAQQGDLAGMAALGVLCAGSYGGVPDYPAALSWLSRAAQAGHADAQYWYAVVAEQAQASSVPEGADHAPGEANAATAAVPVSATQWLERAAEQGHVPAMYRLGLAHWGGRHTPRDTSRAETWLRRAVAREHVDAMRALAQLQLEQAGNDGVEAASLLWQAAELGDARSAALLGELYLQGRGAPRDAVEAARWLASAGGEARHEAMTALARLLTRGEDVDAGHGQARVWLERSAAAGDLAAAQTLGSLFHRGMGVPRDDARAVAWFTRAAEAGSSAAAFYLGLLHADASSPCHDDRQALHWLRLAARRGHALAVCNGAALVHRGRGRAASTAAAVQMLTWAVARGNLPATRMLAQWHLDGLHLPFDPRRAFELLRPAVARGDILSAAWTVQLHLRHGLPADLPRLRALLEPIADATRFESREAQQVAAQARLALAQLLERSEAAPDEALGARIAGLYDGAAAAGLVDAQVWRALKWQATPGGADGQQRRQAAQWLHSAAAQGHVEALQSVDAAIALGEDSDAAGLLDPTDRFAGWLAAALTGHVAAQREIGKMYLTGDGCQADATTALRWLQRAADNGDAEAQFCLGNCLAQGLGCARQAEGARRWWQTAAAAGHGAARQRLADIGDEEAAARSATQEIEEPATNT